MVETQRQRLPSALELTETILVLQKLTASVARLTARERVRRYAGEPGDLTQIDWSHLQNAVASLRALIAGQRCSGGAISASHSAGGSRT